MYKLSGAPAEVTVAIPTRNRPALLRDAIASVLSQTFTNFTILVCDNASTTDNLAVVEYFSDPRIIYHRHERNIGIQHNWRFALETPQTKYVALLMDDDLYLPHHLENGLNALVAYPEATYFGCKSETIGAAQVHTQEPYWLSGDASVSITLGRDNPFVILRGNPVTSASLICRRTGISSICHWGGKTWPGVMDRLWMGQLFLDGGLAYDPTVGVLYRWHEQMDTHNWVSSGMVSVDERYVVQVLASIAFDRGFLSPAALVDQVCQWPAPDASRVVLSLASRSVSTPLREAAFAIYHRHPTLKNERCSKHLLIAKRLGAWYLSVADSMDRVRLRWPRD